MPVHKHAMHMTLPVPEHDPHLSCDPTLTAPLLAWLINGWLFASA